MKQRTYLEPLRVPPRVTGRLLEASSMPIVETAREHAPNDDRRVSQYGLPGSENADGPE